MLRKQSFLAPSHLLLLWAKHFHFFKKQSKPQPSSTKPKREPVYVRIIWGILQKHLCSGPQSRMHSLESQVYGTAPRAGHSPHSVPRCLNGLTRVLAWNCSFYHGASKRYGTTMRSKQLDMNARRCSVPRTSGVKGNPKFVSHPLGRGEGS